VTVVLDFNEISTAKKSIENILALKKAVETIAHDPEIAKFPPKHQRLHREWCGELW
jgi:hypothetical protein